MDKNGIDDLLKVVSPELIKGYEAKNLDGKTLKEVNDEYELAGKRVDNIPRYTILAYIFTLLMIPGARLLESGLIPVVLIVFVMLLIAHFSDKRISKFLRVVRINRLVLDTFQQSVDELNQLGVNKEMPVSTSDSVWASLFFLAIRVLEAKSEFLAECKSENPRMEHVQKIIAWEQDCRRRFNLVFVATTKFGLNFSKERIYKAAQDEIDSRFIVCHK